MLAEKFRNRIFWLIDWIKGYPIGRDLRDIRSKLDQSSNSVQKNAEALHVLLTHATSSTVFYQQYSPVEIGSFPVIDKMTIRNNFDSFVSVKTPVQRLIPVVTSGSTGTPFKVYHDRRKKNRNSADTIFFAGKAGFEMGHRLAYLKIWAKEKMSSPWRYRLQNMCPIDVIHLDDRQIDDLLCSMERDRATYGILGYVSALELVCRYLDRSSKSKVNARVHSIITMSESLTDYVKTSMEKYFGSPVFARYSNLENGILAQQIPGSSGLFLINTASYYVEIFKMSEDILAEKGELGRIVVTDLYNYSFPMIRYDTGDIGAISRQSDRYGNLYLEVVEGRKLDVLYDTQGKIVSSYIMYKNMWKYTDIKQYQLIQKDKKRYVLRINADLGFDRESQLVDEFCSYLGLDADFSIEYVEEIPLLDSGKRRKLVNEMIART